MAVSKGAFPSQSRNNLRVARTQEVCVMRLPLHRVTRQGMISVLQRQHVLEDIDEGLFAEQSLAHVAFEGVGHWIMREAEQDFYQRLGDWLSHLEQERQ